MGHTADKNSEELKAYLLNNLHRNIVYTNSLLLEMLDRRWGNTVLQRTLKSMVGENILRTWQTTTRDRFYELSSSDRVAF